MYEIEVKARISSVNDWRARLEADGVKFMEPFTQDDQTFAETDWDYTETCQRIVMRLRRQNDTVILTLKRSLTNELDGIELETVVSDYDATAAMLCEMGYEPQVRIKKTRQLGTLGDIAICLDDVEGLGSYIELEQMGDEGDGTAIQKQLWQQLLDWGAQQKDRETRGYDTLLKKMIG